MLIKAASLAIAMIVTSFLIAKYVFDESTAASMPGGAGIASSVMPQTSTPAVSSADCFGGTFVNPFASAKTECDGRSPDTSALIQDMKDASSIGKTLRELDPCKESLRSDHCNRAPPVEAKLVERLEDMTRAGDSQARFELAMQLQRQEERTGRVLRNGRDVAQDTDLQRAVALVAEAAAAGNPDAVRFKDSIEDGGRLFHTGR